MDSTTLPHKASCFCCPPKKSIWLLWVVPCFPGSTPSKLCWTKSNSHDSRDVSPRWNPGRWIYSPGPLKAGILPAYVRKAPFHRAKATAVKPRTPKRRLVIFNGKDRPSNQKHDVRIQRCLWWFVFVTVFESANTLPPSQNLYNTQTLTIMICSVLLCIHIYTYEFGVDLELFGIPWSGNFRFLAFCILFQKTTKNSWAV